jgi:hypothetical protein
MKYVNINGPNSDLVIVKEAGTCLPLSVKGLMSETRFHTYTKRKVKVRFFLLSVKAPCQGDVRESRDTAPRIFNLGIRMIS